MKPRTFWSAIVIAASVAFATLQPSTSQALHRPSRTDAKVLASKAGKGIKNAGKGAKKSLTNAKDSASAALKRGGKAVKHAMKSQLPHSSHVFNPEGKKRNKLTKKRPGNAATNF
jgi:hypothetical protein